MTIAAAIPILGNTINNNGTGVSITGGGGDPILGNLIQNNVGIGISIISADDNTIGGMATDAGNLIKGNNTGVSINKGNRNSIFGNSIIVNMGIGVAIASGNSNPILNNTISGNGLGIVLGPPGPTLNDSSGHADANHLQNFPKLDSITTSPDGTSTRILGQLNSTPNTTFTIQLFEDVQYPSGFGQGMIFDEVRVTTDANGIAPIDVSRQGAIPIRLRDGDEPDHLDTSEFSPRSPRLSTRSATRWTAEMAHSSGDHQRQQQPHV